MKSLVFGIAFLALVAVSYGQQTDGKQYCQSILSCYDEAQKLADDCQKQNANHKPANASAVKASGCKAATKDKQTQLRQKQLDHRKMVTDCVKSRVNEAMPIPAKKADKCSGTSQPQPTGDGNGPRPKRQNVNMTSSTSTSTSTSTDSAGGRGKGKGKGHGNGQGKGKGKGNGCQKQVQQKHKQCNEIKKCCSEVEYCEQKYEVSGLHDEVHQLQLDILDQKHKCYKEQGQASQATKPSMKNNVLRDSPIEDDDDDEDFDMEED